MRLIIIAALSRNRVIGKNGKIPWHISEDLKRFKRITTGHVIMMGRKTFESLGKPLPNRRNIVVTSRQIAGIETYGTPDEALKALSNEEKVFVIGGGQLFAQTLDRADELLLTIIPREVDGDVYFPPYEHLIGKKFRETAKEVHEGYSFVDFVRNA